MKNSENLATLVNHYRKLLNLNKSMSKVSELAARVIASQLNFLLKKCLTCSAKK